MMIDNGGNDDSDNGYIVIIEAIGRAIWSPCNP